MESELMGLRLLALRIACLVEADRHWLFGSLGESERLLLAPIVDEVLSLGLNADPTVLAQLQTSADFQRQPARISLPETWAPLLASWSPVWVGVLLCEFPEDARANLLALMPESTRQAIVRMDITAAPPGLKQFLLEYARNAAGGAMVMQP